MLLHCRSAWCLHMPAFVGGRGWCLRAARPCPATRPARLLAVLCWDPAYPAPTVPARTEQHQQVSGPHPLTDEPSSPCRHACACRYDRVYIQRWLLTRTTCPCTGLELQKPVLLRPAHKLRREIEGWVTAWTPWALVRRGLGPHPGSRCRSGCPLPPRLPSMTAAMAPPWLLPAMRELPHETEAGVLLLDPGRCFLARHL